jgi:hypothetical protein
MNPYAPKNCLECGSVLIQCSGDCQRWVCIATYDRVKWPHSDDKDQKEIHLGPCPLAETMVPGIKTLKDLYSSSRSQFCRACHINQHIENVGDAVKRLVIALVVPVAKRSGS